MKISFFIGTMRRGGAERVISILANHYCDLGWDVEICLLLNYEVGYELNKKIEVVDLSTTGSNYLFRLPKWIRKIRNHVKSHKPDRIVSFIGRINVLVITACLGLKIPIIASERNDPLHDGRGHFMLWLCNQCYKRTKAVVFQTNYEKSCFSENLCEKSHVIVNPVTVKVIRKKTEELYVVTAGRLVPQKNHKLLIEAISILCKDYPNVKLVIYGNGELKDKLQDTIESLHLTPYVELAGNVPDLHERISGATVFVMTSEFEGLSNALIEAMMIGLPCICTDYPGVREIINDGENGLLVPRGDVEQLSAGLRRVIDSDELQEKLGTKAMLSTESYKEALVLKQWDKVIIGGDQDEN